MHLTYKSTYSQEYRTKDTHSDTLTLWLWSFIYLVTSAECAWPINRPTAVKGLDFMKKIK